MTIKEEYLVNKGYNKDLVLNLCGYTEEELEYAINSAIGLLTYNANSVSNPKCIYIGGQPGVGKSVFSDKLNRVINGVELSMDACRMFHPRYHEIEATIKDFYSVHDITSENNPGNDIANFTQDFSSAMVNTLIDRISDMKYNILLEWNMRNSSDVLACMQKLHNKGYINEALVIAANKDLSLEACKIRADVMNNHGHISRRVPNSFHQLCLDTIPKNVDIIYKNGKENGILNKLNVVLRDGTVIWNDKNSLDKPSEALNNYYYNVSLTKKFKNDSKWAEMSFWKESIGLNYKMDNVLYKQAM